MLRRTERILENIPVGSLGLISLTILHFRDMKKILIFLMPAFRALAQEKQKEFSESPFAEKICILW